MRRSADRPFAAKQGREELLETISLLARAVDPGDQAAALNAMVAELVTVLQGFR